MEAYSPGMATAVRAHLQAATAAELRDLRTYYLRRQGPGLALLCEEYRRRGLPAPPEPPHS